MSNPKAENLGQLKQYQKFLCFTDNSFKITPFKYVTLSSRRDKDDEQQHWVLCLWL